MKKIELSEIELQVKGIESQVYTIITPNHGEFESLTQDGARRIIQNLTGIDVITIPDIPGDYQMEQTVLFKFKERKIKCL